MDLRSEEVGAWPDSMRPLRFQAENVQWESWLLSAYAGLAARLELSGVSDRWKRPEAVAPCQIHARPHAIDCLFWDGFCLHWVKTAASQAM